MTHPHRPTPDRARTSGAAPTATLWRRGRLATRRGETTLSLIVGLTIGGLIIASFLAFWIRSNHIGANTESLTRQQSSGLNVLNRIARDIGDASTVSLASKDQIVIDQVDPADGDITRIQYAKDADGSLYTITREDAPDTYDPAHPGWGPDTKREYLAKEVRTANDGSPLFTFVDGESGKLTPAQLPAYNPGLASGIKRIDIAFAAHAGEGQHGYVELRTSAALNTGPGGEVDPHIPACPLPFFVGTDPYRLQWDVTGQTVSYQILRNGAVIGTRDYDDTTAEGVYQFPLDFLSGETYDGGIPFQVLAIGPDGIVSGDLDGDGKNSTCSSILWYPRLATPSPTASLQAAATESPDWLTSGVNVPTVSITWPAVKNAYGYEVYRRPLENQAPYSTAGSYQRVGLLTSPTSTSFTDPNLAWDSAYEYQVVANGPMPEASKPSAGMKVLTHTKAPTRVTADPTTYNQNHVSWTGDPGETATGFAVYRRDTTGCFPAYSSWQKIAGPLSLEQTEFVDTSAPLSTRFEYAVGAYNIGPRGTSTDRQYASLLSASDQALQFPANPTTSAWGSSTSPGVSRGALATGFTVSNPGVSNVAWSSPCAATTSTYRLDLYGSSRTTPYSSRGMGSLTSWTDPGWFGPATEHNYKAVAYNATGASPNAENASGLVSAYQYSNQPSNGSTSVFRDDYTVYSGYTDDNVRPSSALGSCYSSPVNVDDSHWQGAYEPKWVDGYYIGGYDRVWVEGYYTGGYDKVWVPAWWENGVRHPGYWDQVWNPYHDWHDGYYKDVWNAKKTWVPGYWHDVWNPQHEWIPDSDGDLWDYQWYCYRYRGGYTVTWNESADTGESGNSFCDAGRGNCSATVYWNDTGSQREATATGPGPYSRTYYWYTARIEGHDYSYTVSQPDGTISCNAGGCAASTRPTVCGGSGCLPPPQPDVAPDPPAFKVLGSDTNGDTIPDANYNTVMWNPVPRATGYTVFRYSTYSNGEITSARVSMDVGGAAPCPANSGYKLCFFDSSRVAGTETYYKVAAYNAKGATESAALLPAYQRPTATTLTLVSKPTPDDTTVRWTWTKNADGGQPAAGKFCGTSANRGRCSYTLEGYDLLHNKVGTRWALGRDVDSASVRQPAGTSYQYTLKVCNDGGCLPFGNTTRIDTPPGEFKITSAVQTSESRGNKWYVNVAQILDRNYQTINVGWSASKGASYYRFGYVEKSGDPFDVKFPASFDPADSSTGYKATDRETTPRRVTPSAYYRYSVWAVAENGLKREVNTTVLARPAKPLFGEVGRFCKVGDGAVNKSGWKTGYRIHPDGTTMEKQADGSIISRRSSPDRVQWAWWTGLLEEAAYTGGGDAAGAAGLQHVQDIRSLDPVNPDTWKATWSASTQYHDSSFGQRGGWLPGDTPISWVLGGSTDKRLIPWQRTAWAAFAPYSWNDVNPTTYDLGSDYTTGNSYHIGTGGDPLSCGNAVGSGWQWNGNSESMGRWANLSEQGGGYFQAPADRGNPGAFGVTR